MHSLNLWKRYHHPIYPPSSRVITIVWISLKFLTIYPIWRWGKKFSLYSIGRRHKKLLRMSPQSLFWSHYPWSWSMHTWKRTSRALLLFLHLLPLLKILRRCKKAIGWKISDLKGISPLVCTHHIYMEEEAKSVRQP